MFIFVCLDLVSNLVVSLAIWSHTRCSACRTKRILGICYMVVKVSLLVVVEIGLFPLICGWWLDICSLVSSCMQMEVFFRFLVLG